MIVALSVHAYAEKRFLNFSKNRAKLLSLYWPVLCCGISASCLQRLYIGLGLPAGSKRWHGGDRGEAGRKLTVQKRKNVYACPYLRGIDPS